MRASDRLCVSVPTSSDTRSFRPKRTPSLCLAALALLLVTVSTRAQTPTYTQPYRGVTQASVSVSASQSISGRAHSYHAFVIDLGAPGLSFKTTPSNNSGTTEVRTQRTSDFINQENAQIGINANFFVFNGSLSTLFGTQPYDTTLTGIAASNGTVVSRFEQNYPNGLNIGQDNRAQFLTGGVNGTTNNAQGITPYNAIGFNGPGLLINNGTINNSLATTTQTSNAFPGIALTPDQRLILLASSSITYREMAYAFQYLAGGSSGLYAMFLDGGGSTSLYVRNPESQSLTTLVGSSRAVGNSLLVFASPVPEPATATALLGILSLMLRRHRDRH